MTPDRPGYRRRSGPAPGFVEIHPCRDCPHENKCKQGYACRLLATFVRTGCFSPIADRTPSRAIFDRLYR